MLRGADTKGVVLSNNMFPLIEIDVEEFRLENLGTKEKFWVNYDGRSCLFKVGRIGTGENWAEKVACELGSLIDIPHAKYDFASCKGKLGTISYSIVPRGGRLISGNELLPKMASYDEGARFYNHKGHTIRRVFAVLRTFTSNPEESLHNFLGYLMFDAWIGNSDRHHENWGLINQAALEVYLAPTFDHASSLGRELSDKKRETLISGNDPRVSVATYSSKARSALYSNAQANKPLSPIDAFSYASKMLRPQSEYWLSQLEKVSIDHINEVLSKVPDEYMSPISKKFALEILVHNRNRVLEERDSG